MRSRKRERTRRSDVSILASDSSMTMLRCVSRCEVVRGETGGEASVFAPYYLAGEPADRVLLRILHSEEAIEMPISGPPRLTTRGWALLRQATDRPTTP